MKKRILYLLAQNGLGGTERRAVDLLTAFGSKYQTSLYSIKGRQFHTAVEQEPAAQKEAGIIGTVTGLMALRRVLARLRPNLIHACDLQSGIYAKTGLLTLRGRRPCLIAEHASSILGDARTRGILRKGWLLPDQFVCNCDSGLQALDEVVGRAVPSQVLYNGLDTLRIERYLHIAN